jgi:hypothetical protein
MLFFIPKMTNSVSEMELRWSEIKRESYRISTIEDSLLYNPAFKKREYPLISTRAEYDSIIRQNRAAVKGLIKEAEELKSDRMRLQRNYNIFQGMDHLLDLLFAIVAGVLIYNWFKRMKLKDPSD